MQGLTSLILLVLPLLADAAPSIVGQGAPSTGYGALHVARLQRVKRDRMLGKRACQVKPNSISNGMLVVAGASTASSSVVSVASATFSSSPAPAATQAAAPAPAVAAAPAPVPAPAPATFANGSHKQKTGWGSNNPSWVNAWLFTGASWVYNWSPWPTDIYRQMNIEFVPMFWGAKQIGDFYTNLPNYPSWNVKWILFLNEPDQSGQSNLSPADAAALYWQHMAGIRGQYSIVGPALTSSPGSIAWQQQFMPMINYGVDAMALHWYGDNGQSMIDYLNEFHGAFPGYNIWVTEYACNSMHSWPPCKQSQAEFYGQVNAFMDNTPWIQRSAAFGALVDLSGLAEECRLLSADGQSLTAIGNQVFN